ncbi:MAG: hypothetical protein KGJ91_06050 [Xanthomonadaceae bacterium]|nr:hypothetical protein [Xanthomonadaceae bacterium]
MRSRRFLLLLLLPCAAPAFADDYASMLQYLTRSSLDGNALAGAHGVIAVNLAAGDANLQTNLGAIVVGAYAQALVQPAQQIETLQASRPDSMSARIAGNALAGVRGIVSINQVSGIANRQVNAVTMQLSQQGIHEEAADDWFAASFANTDASRARPAGASSGEPRSAAVSSSALRGLEGVVQINQVAGMGNLTANQLQLNVESPPR